MITVLVKWMICLLLTFGLCLNENDGRLSWSLLKADVSLLTDVFEKFIDIRWEYYGLDIWHYFSSPGLSWDAMIIMTEIKLNCVSDNCIDLLYEKWMGGCICYIAKKHSKPNNKYMKSFNDNKLSNVSYIWMQVICMLV